MNAIILLLPLLLLVSPAVAHGQQATVTPPGSKIESLTVTPLTYTHLNGTWNFVNGYGNVSGTITFGAEELKCNWCQGSERQYGFVGIFGIIWVYQWNPVIRAE